jgi:DNA-binding transcriptional MerR regulator
MFNIGAVARMTNITEATLRVWERRYKFPQSTRTTGGHRLYSQQEILRLQWVKTRIDEGLQVSHAIRALQRAEQDGVFVPVPGPTTPVAQPIVEDDMSISSLHQRLLSALQKHDIDSASHIIGQAQALFPLEEVVLDLIGPAMHDIGEAWETGKVDVATEHLATNFLRQYLLTWIRVGPPAYGVNPVVLACAPGELHEGSLLMLAVLLRRLRWPVLYLGQTMPLESFDMFLEDLSPPLVVFVAMGEESALALAEWQHWLPTVAANDQPQICFGGRAFVSDPTLINKVPGVYLGDTLQEGLQTLNATLHRLNPRLFWPEQ